MQMSSLSNEQIPWQAISSTHFLYYCYWSQLNSFYYFFCRFLRHIGLGRACFILDTDRGLVGRSVSCLCWGWVCHDFISGWLISFSFSPDFLASFSRSTLQGRVAAQLPLQSRLWQWDRWEVKAKTGRVFAGDNWHARDKDEQYSQLANQTPGSAPVLVFLLTGFEVYLLQVFFTSRR